MDLNKVIPKAIKSHRKSQQQLYNYTYTHLGVAVALYLKDKTELDWVFNLGMMKIFTSLDKYQLKTNYLGWARTILVRTTIDHLRKNNKSNLIKISTTEEVQIESSDFEDLMNSQDTDDLILLIEKLQEKQRLVFNLFEIEGYSHQEIEDLTKIKKNTSKWLLSEAKKNLKEMILSSSKSRTASHE